MLETNTTNARDRAKHHRAPGIVKVPLSNTDKFATVEADVYAELVAMGLGGPWFWNEVNDGYHYVRVKVRDIPGTLETVARIIAGAGRRQCVKYENGDRADLRRSNLYFGDGHAKHDTVARLTPETVH